MRAVIQRVGSARVRVEEKTCASIGQGLLVLLGVEHDDEPSDLEWLVKKIVSMRIFSDSEGKMNLSINDINGEIIVVSQFTLHASTKKGNRPSFIRAAKPEIAENSYLKFVKTLEGYVGRKVQTGIFGAMMEVELINDGPVTIIIDSKNRE
jgi:D-tyrosyl-tRNA(Tyr) deacylase